MAGFHFHDFDTDIRIVLLKTWQEVRKRNEGLCFGHGDAQTSAAFLIEILDGSVSVSILKEHVLRALIKPFSGIGQRQLVAVPVEKRGIQLFFQPDQLLA